MNRYVDALAQAAKPMQQDVTSGATVRNFYHQYSERISSHAPCRYNAAVSDAFRQEAYEFSKERRNGTCHQPHSEEQIAFLVMTGLRMLSFPPSRNHHALPTREQCHRTNHINSVIEDCIQALALLQHGRHANHLGAGFNYGGSVQSRYPGSSHNALPRPYSGIQYPQPYLPGAPNGYYDPVCRSGADYNHQSANRPLQFSPCHQVTDNQSFRAVRPSVDSVDVSKLKSCQPPRPIDIEDSNECDDSPHGTSDVYSQKPLVDRRDGSSLTEVQEGIISHATANVGRELWRGCGGTEGGRLGCAASVSTVLGTVGFNYARSAAVGDPRGQSGLVGQLMQHGWTLLPVTAGQPGDVIFGRYPDGQHGHVGIIGERVCEKLTVYDNNSCTRKWGRRNLSDVFNSSKFGNQLYVLRAPESGCGK